jgi:hypothetical protein
LHDIADRSRSPIIASHSGARHVEGFARFLDDNEIRAVARTGGVVGLWPYHSQKPRLKKVDPRTPPSRSSASRYPRTPDSAPDPTAWNPRRPAPAGRACGSNRSRPLPHSVSRRSPVTKIVRGKRRSQKLDRSPASGPQMTDRQQASEPGRRYAEPVRCLQVGRPASAEAMTPANAPTSFAKRTRRAVADGRVLL